MADAGIAVWEIAGRSTSQAFMVPFTVTNTPIEPIWVMASGSGSGVPNWDIRDEFPNEGTMLVVNADGQSHVLSPRGASRVLFVGRDGTLLQDSGLASRAPQRAPDLATVRLTLVATVDLQGESPDAARALLMRMVDRAVLAGAMPGEPDVRVLEHAFEGSAVLSADNSPSSTHTDFSQLLDL